MERKVIIFGHYRECCAGLKERVNSSIKTLLGLGERLFCIDIQNDFGNLVLDVLKKYMATYPDIVAEVVYVNAENMSAFFDGCKTALCYVETERNDVMCKNLIDVIESGASVQNLFCLGDDIVYPM